MTVSLKNGNIHVAMDLGTGSYNDLVSPNGYNLDDGQWHTIEVSRDSRKVSYGSVVGILFFLDVHFVDVFIT